MPKSGRRRHKQQNYSYGVRDAYAIASPTFEAFLEPLNGLHLQSFRDPVATLSEVEDHRYFYPGQDDSRARSSRRSHVTPQLLPSRARARARARGVKLFSPSHQVMGFRAPLRVAICVRRKVRDQVLHALGKTGKGSGRPRRRTRFSNVRC